MNKIFAYILLSMIAIIGVAAEERVVGATAAERAMLPMPDYTVIHRQMSDSIMVILTHQNTEAKIYANLTESHDKLHSQAVDTLRFPFWTIGIITAWAEAGDKKSDYVHIPINETRNSSTGDENDVINYDPISPIEDNNPNDINSYVVFSDLSVMSFGSSAGMEKPWYYVSGDQVVEELDNMSPSKVIGADNGPIDIYSADNLQGHSSPLLLGKAHEDDARRAYLQTAEMMKTPTVLDIHMRGDSLGAVNQQLALKISYDGTVWMSVDTLNSEQLKPIRRFQVLIPETRNRYFIRIESATTPATECQTYIYNIRLIGLKMRVVGGDMPIPPYKTVSSIDYYDLHGRHLSTLPRGSVVMVVITYSDSTRDIQKLLVEE
ncbi:MAG: hypothetical protein IJ776_10200 [Paludibacteraceae bacterium]|nr:hypothetical protein [Paludibacteraceae bacterium]